MFCPDCGVEKPGFANRYCTNCGLDLLPVGRNRQAATRQGLALIVVGLGMIPIWMFVGAAFPPADKLVESAPSTTFLEALVWILMWIAFILGAARIISGFLIEGTSRANAKSERDPNSISTNDSAAGLPAGDMFEPARAGKWKTTSELDVGALTNKTSGNL